MSSAKNPPEAERQLSLMINHFITANALPFHLSECPLLNRMLVLARNTNNSYKPPRRTEMSGALLDANYTAYQSSSLQKLLTNANIFGLGIYGDGATIGKIPMMNILAASAGNPNCVIDIIDCSRHMSEGGKKMLIIYANKCCQKCVCLIQRNNFLIGSHLMVLVMFRRQVL
jgi:hypothetical protein